MSSAPTDKEAALERTRGIIASSTYLAGLERNQQPTTDPQDLEEDDEVYEGDGEGGLDEKFFEALSRSEQPIAPTPAVCQHVHAMECDNWGICFEPDEQVKARANMAVWEGE